LRPPPDPKTGRVAGRVWWWVIPFVLIFGLEQLLPAIPGPSVRDFGDFLGTDRAEDFFRGRVGLVRAACRACRLQHGARRGASLPRASVAPYEGRLRKVRLGCQRGALRDLPPSPAVGHSYVSGRHRRSLVPPRGGSKARGWGSSCTRLRASSSSSLSLRSWPRSERAGREVCVSTPGALTSRQPVFHKSSSARVRIADARDARSSSISAVSAAPRGPTQTPAFPGNLRSAFRPREARAHYCDPDRAVLQLSALPATRARS
jgi:hypothetical protein